VAPLAHFKSLLGVPFLPLWSSRTIIYPSTSQSYP